MKTIVVLASLILIVSFAVTAFAAQEQIGVGTTATAVKTAATPAAIPVNQKNQFKQTLRNYFKPVNHGYGIGFTEETYITAKWHITNVKILPRVNVNTMIREVKQGNNTDWDALRTRIREALNAGTTTVKKGRIRIEGRDYALTNIVVSSESITADINQVPNYSACKNDDLSAEDCETSSEKVGDISMTKKTKASQEVAGREKVWAGTLTLNGIGYTFVTFVYPK
ncbi:MAG: hypothetical protein ABIE55_01545 [Candidatus Aenigmatarchaeota archaeon]